MCDNYIGEIKAFPYVSYVPDGWLPCIGQQLAIMQYQALYAVIGHIYDPKSNPNPQQYFYLPDLRGVVPVGATGNASSVAVGQTGGAETVAITSQTQIPAHSHNVQAIKRGTTTVLTNTPANNTYLTDGASVSQNIPIFLYSTQMPPQTIMSSVAIGVAGVANPVAHENRMPFLPMQFGICWSGVFPMRP